MLTTATTTLKPVRQQVAMNQYRGAIFTPATTKSSGAKKRHINSSAYGRTAAKGIALKMIWYTLCTARSAANATGITNSQRNHVGSLKMSLSTHCCTSINLHLHTPSYAQPQGHREPDLPATRCSRWLYESSFH